jgi:hypothetical protein
MASVPLAILVASGIGWLESGKRHALGWLLAAAAALPLLGNLRRFDFSSDTTGIAYVRDLLSPTPARALVLISGDMAGHATLYGCAVERLCADRTVLAPGQLFLPWKARQAARRFPELGLTGSSETRPTVAQLVEAELARRPVYVHPELVRKHPELARRFVLVPELLLVRVYRDDAARAADAALLRARYEALLGDGCAECRASLAGIVHPSMQPQLLDTYAGALHQQARAARELGYEDLAPGLDARARAFSIE